MLPENVTLEGVVATLDTGDSFVAAALHNMRLCEKAGTPVNLRLGRTGTGKAPNYKLEDCQTGELVGAYDGANHNTYSPLPGTSTNEAWSTATMNFDAVEALLRKLRKFYRS